MSTLTQYDLAKPEETKSTPHAAENTKTKETKTSSSSKKSRKTRDDRLGLEA